MEAATAGLESLLRYQEMLFLVLIAMLMIAACLMTAVCLLLLWFEGPSPGGTRTTGRGLPIRNHLV